MYASSLFIISLFKKMTSSKQKKSFKLNKTLTYDAHT